MVITPNSDIILLKCNLKLDNYNQITFGNATAQYNYFHSLTKLECDDATYVRKDGVIRFPTHTELNDNLPTYEDLLKYNYCMYKNTSFSNKWFYAFITDITYINDGMSEIKIETDVFQTWQFDIVYKNSFIEREHVSNDTVGLHTIPEGLETGEYVVNAENQNRALQVTDILVASTIDLTTYAPNSDRYGGVYQGYCLYRFTNNSTGITALANTLTQMNTDQKLDSIVGIFLCPAWFFTTDNIGEGEKVTPSATPSGFTWGGNYPASGDSEIHKLTTLNGYSPRNNKLKTYPYMYLLMDNGNGGNATYKFEDFNDPIDSTNCEFQIIGTPSFGGSFFVTPVNYKNAVDGFNERLAGGKYPVCGFQNDTFINWLTANSVPMVISGVTDIVTLGTSLAGMVGGLATGGSLSVAGAVGAYSSSANILKTMSSYYEHSKQPPQHVGNSSSGDVNFATGITTFTAYSMSIKGEYARCIDDFFTAYGYKVNKLATPNIHKRSNFDYIKCIDVNLEGEIPEIDLDKIRKLFNDGCTFWHTTSHYLDYSQTNSIL